MAKGKKTGGRTKGTPNKTTHAVKSALIAAFDKLGGVVELTSWARSNPTEFYKLWSRILPQEIHAEHSGIEGAPIAFSINIGDAGNDRA